MRRLLSSIGDDGPTKADKDGAPREQLNLWASPEVVPSSFA